AGEYGIDSVMNEHRLEDQSKPSCPTAITTGRVERMVKETDLPLCLGLAEAFVEPAKLRAIEIRGVEREELDACRDLCQQIFRRREAVVAFAVHVEKRVNDLVRVVVIAKRGVEL